VTRAARVLAASLTAALALGAGATEAPRLANGRLETHAAGAGLERSFRELVASSSAGPAWIGYAVASDTAREMCCYESWNGGPSCIGCWLEGRKGAASSFASDDAVRLEGSSTMLVLFRAEAGSVGKIRTVAPACPLDAGGLTLHWLSDVRPAESLRLLASFVQDQDGIARAAQRASDGAISAIAMHADPSAVDWLLHKARDGASRHLRGQALFWLAQRAGDKAVPAITRALDDDPDTEVKKKAVFALSQLPKDEGVPLLIHTARANKNPEVRRQAFFWLGQSKDARATAFFAEVLLR